VYNNNRKYAYCAFPIIFVCQCRRLRILKVSQYCAKNMKFRKFGKLDWQASVLGFGCMRFPVVNNSDAVDEKESIRMIRYAIDNGVNYLDSAYGYHEGKSEVVLGKALKAGYRQKVKLTTKIPVWAVNTESDFDKVLDEQLKRLNVDYIDFYLFHSLNIDYWKKIQKFNLIEKAQSAIKEGKIRNIGFSSHDSYKNIKTIIDSFDQWVLCQFQYNYLDSNSESVKYAASKGLAVVVMEPLLGGKLSNPPQIIKDIFDNSGYRKERSPSDWALQWVWNQQEISVVLSGMSAMQQVQENIKSANISSPGLLNRKELKVLERARAQYEKLIPIKCTGCNYCKPCPQKINIPWVFELYNKGFIHQHFESYSRAYSMLGEAKADACIQCAKCEKKCPQGLPISKFMSKVSGVFKTCAVK